MGNLVIALIGVAFAAALMLAGVNYLSPDISIVATNSVSLDNEVSGILADYNNLQTNVQHVPQYSDYTSVYAAGSGTSNYTYNNGAVTRTSALPGTGSGWAMTQNCGAPNNAVCFCLTVTPSGSGSSDQAIYRSALVAAKKLATGSGVSQIAYNTGANGCTMTNALQYGSWPDPASATPAQPYVLVVATNATASSSACSCTQGTSTYACGSSWENPGPSNTRPCTKDPDQPTPPWTTGTETQSVALPFSCVELANGTGKITSGPPDDGPWNNSQCSTNVIPACITPTPQKSGDEPGGNLCNSGTQSSVTPDTSAGKWTWVCTGSNGSTKNCSSPGIFDGQCNTATESAAATSTAPTAECYYGTPGPVREGTNAWLWTCGGTNGGSNANCTAAAECPSGILPVGGYFSPPTFPGCVISCLPLAYNSTTNSCYVRRRMASSGASETIPAAAT